MHHDPETLCVGCFSAVRSRHACSICGFIEQEQEERASIYLPLRTLLQEQYIVGRNLGRPGGFGITYLALDVNLQERVAIKEFLPAQLANREPATSQVVPVSSQAAEDFHYGLEAFLEEARTLALFRHPQIVRIRNFFQTLGTSYIVMDFYEGETLEEFLASRGGKLPAENAMELMDPILVALQEEVHPKQYLHRDISPQNIYLSRVGKEVRPLLIDFGAARQSILERNQKFSVILKPGFAPLEQNYVDGHQGPWTDVYACAATLYRAVTGQIPIASEHRLDEDRLAPPDTLVEGLPQHFAQALMRGLAVHAEARPQSAGELRDLLSPPPPEGPSPVEDLLPLSLLPILRGLKGEMANLELPLDDLLIIGRDPRTCQLVLTRGDLSRQHCAVSFDPAAHAFKIEDLESSYGTFVEQGGQVVQLEVGQPVPMGPGDSFHLIDPECRFQVDLRPNDASPAPPRPATPPPPAAPGTIAVTKETPSGCILGLMAAPVFALWQILHRGWLAVAAAVASVGG